MLIVDVDERTKARIDRLLSTDRGYSSQNEFIKQAIYNQLVLEESGKTGDYKLGSPPRFQDDEDSRIVADVAEESPSRKNEGRPSWEMLMIPSSPPHSVQPHKLPDEIRDMATWGMNYRISAGKFALRFLANRVAQEGKDWTGIEDVKNPLGELAKRAKVVLAEIEKEQHRGRGDKLSSAFPNDDRASVRRYLNQYLGDLSGNGKQRGLLADYRFIEMQRKHGLLEIAVTDSGAKFCMMKNPLIDEALIGHAAIATNLSEEEFRFLVDHLGEHRPGELRFLKHVARSIGGGRDTPSKLLDTVHDYLKREKYPGLTHNVAVTMRVGAVGKLVECGVVTLKNEFGAVTYFQNDRQLIILEGTDG